MNSNSLKATIGVIVLLCAAALVGTAVFLRKRHAGQNSARAGRLGPATFVIGQIDVAQMRSWSITNTLHRRFATPGEAQGRAMVENARHYQEMVTNCGFDPYDRVTGLVIGADRTALAGTNPNALAVFMDGRFTPAEVTRCVTWIAQQDHATVATSQLRGHTLLASNSGTGTPGHGAQFALLDGTVLGSDQSYMPTALAVADGAQPGLAADSPLNVMLSRLGSGNMANVVVDIAAVRAQNQHDADDAVDEAVRNNPTQPNLVLAKQATLGGFGVRVLNNAVTAMARVELPSAQLASQFSSALQGVITARRPDINNMIGEARAGVSSMRALGALRGGGGDLGPQFDQINAALDVFAALPAQLVVTTDAVQTVVTLPVSAQQVTTLESAVRALGEIIQQGSQNRGRPSPPPGLELPMPAPGAPMLDDHESLRNPGGPAQVPSQGANPSLQPSR